MTLAVLGQFYYSQTRDIPLKVLAKEISDLDYALKMFSLKCGSENASWPINCFNFTRNLLVNQFVSMSRIDVAQESFFLGKFFVTMSTENWLQLQMNRPKVSI